jgi:hypothetical protein
MELLAKDFYFHNNGVYRTLKAQESFTGSYTTDIEEVTPSIRIIAKSKEQIDKAKDDYIKQTGLMLNEVYDFKVEPMGSYWYGVYGAKAERINKETSEKLSEYQKKMKDLNIKVLILNLR